MAISSLSTQYISASFQNLAQISASGELFNGNGTQITNLVLTSVTASVYGVISNATSASYISWSYVDVTTDSIFPGTASYYQETEPIFTAVSASYLTTASYNADSSSFSSRITTLETVDLNINSVTASLVTTSSLNSFTASYNSASSSFSSRITTLEAVDLNLNSLTASLATTGSNTFKSTQTISGSVLISGSIIPNVNGMSTTSSFSLGSPTAAWKDIWVANGTINFINEAGTIQSSLSATSAGLVISGAVVTTNQSSLTGSLLGSASYALTASYALNGGGGSTDTGSLLVTASVSSNTITFTKGNGSTFPITVATGSGGGGSYVPAGPVGSIQYNYDGVQASGSIYFTYNDAKLSLNFGEGVSATGDYSFALGTGCTAPGNYSFAQGFSSDALGEASVATGFKTLALGNYSFAAGSETVASGSDQFVVGRYNTLGDNTSLFIVGNGTNANDRKDFFKITSSGSMIISASYADPNWTGIDGELVAQVNVDDGKYRLWMYANGWRYIDFIS